MHGVAARLGIVSDSVYRATDPAFHAEHRSSNASPAVLRRLPVVLGMWRHLSHGSGSGRAAEEAPGTTGSSKGVSQQTD